MNSTAMRVALTLVCFAAISCQNPPTVAEPSDVTVFEAELVGFTPVPAHQCDGARNACTRTKVMVTNVGTEEGDVMCRARLVDDKGSKVNVIDMLIASNLKPGESTTWDVDYVGRAVSGRAKCDAYDPGALRDIG